MLTDKHWKHVEVIGKGSIYPIKGSAGTMGCAFYFKIDGSDKVRKVVTGKSEDELYDKAERFLQELDMECEEKDRKEQKIIEEMTKPVDLKFSEVANEWLEEYKKRRTLEEGKISYSSVESRECSLKAVNRFIGDMPVRMIDADVAKKLIADASVKEDGTYYSVSHVDKLQQAFKMVMEYARKKGYSQYEHENMVLSSKLKTVDKDSRFLDEEQLNKVFKIINGNRRYRTVVHLLITSGMRQEEAFALNINDFQVLGNGAVQVSVNKTVVETEGHVYKIVNETKTKGSRRNVYIPYEIYEMVKEYYEEVIQNGDAVQRSNREENGLEGFIFLNKYGSPLNKRTFENNFRKFLKRNGNLDFDVTLHMLRHSYVSLHADTLPLDDIAMLIGDSLQTTHSMYRSLSNRAKNKVCENTARFYHEICGK